MDQGARYLREWMGDDYDPCMESREALEKKLSGCVDKMRPEYKRKTALYGIIVARVASLGSVARSELLKHLMDEGAEYIDMTHKGGGLYFFSESIAEDLKGKGYNIGYAEKGSRSTSGRPAWYLRK